MSASASCSSASVTPCGIAAKDFLARAKASLKLNDSQLSVLTSLYSEALQQESIETHCQRLIKSKKTTCGRELKDGKCPTHGDDVFAPVDVPGEPVVVAKCPFVKKDNTVCGRNCAKGKNVCPLHIGKTMSSDMIACTFVLQSGERKGQTCGKMFGQRALPSSVSDADDYYDEKISHYCTTHCDAEINRRIKEEEKKSEKKEKKKSEKKEKKKSEKKEKKTSEKKEKKKSEKKEKSEAEMKLEADPLDSDSDSDCESDSEDLFGKDDDEEIDLPKSAKPAKSYPSFNIKFEESMTAGVIKVKGDETRLLRMKCKAQLYPFIFDRSTYEKEDAIEIVGYTCDLVNKEIEASEFKKEWHPMMDEVVVFYNDRDYKVRISPSLRK